VSCRKFLTPMRSYLGIPPAQRKVDMSRISLAAVAAILPIGRTSHGEPGR